MQHRQRAGGVDAEQRAVAAWTAVVRRAVEAAVLTSDESAVEICAVAAGESMECGDVSARVHPEDRPEPQRAAGIRRAVEVAVRALRQGSLWVDAVAVAER